MIEWRDAATALLNRHEPQIPREEPGQADN
jgi:hypothetical protein